MCAGKASRWKEKRGWKTWGNYLGVRKQLIKIGGEILLERTIRLLQKHNISDILVTVHPEEDWFPVDVTQIPNKTEYEIERFYPSTGKTLYLYGDVFYTEEAINTIVNTDAVFFGRLGKSKVGGKGHSELFAVKGDAEMVAYHVNRVRNALKKGECKRGIGWDLYKSWYNEPWKPERVKNKSHVVDINDATDDFDKPKDYDKWIKNVYPTIK